MPQFSTPALLAGAGCVSLEITLFFHSSIKGQTISENKAMRYKYQICLKKIKLNELGLEGFRHISCLTLRHASHLCTSKMLDEVSSKIPPATVKLQAKNAISIHDLQKIIGPAMLFKASPAKQLSISALRVLARHSGRARERLQACKVA